jgi:cell division protein FtsB
MTTGRPAFNPPPGWPKPPEGWVPPKGWSPDPSWPDPPEGWQLWRADESGADEAHQSSPAGESTPTPAVIDGETVARLQAENTALRAQLDALRSGPEIVVFNDELVLQEVGIYRYHHPLEDAAAYKDRLAELDARIANLVESNGAIESSKTFTFDNSLAKGQRMVSDLAKLMLRAYNAEVDNALRSLRAGNVVTATRRIEASRTAIMRLGGMMQMHISDAFHALRLEELELTADYLMKKQEEREAAVEERARLREERKVAAELEEERSKLTKERSHVLNALESLRSAGSSDVELEQKLAEIDDAIAQNDFRAANIRAGYIYVISNQGAFGPNVVKIGLTRRLEPLDRVNELGGASVPFRFDVHALFFSEDAVSLEADLHQCFASRRLNHANARKEFFFASPIEVREALLSRVGNLLEFAEHVESTEYLQSVHYWPNEQRELR